MMPDEEDPCTTHGRRTIFDCHDPQRVTSLLDAVHAAYLRLQPTDPMPRPMVYVLLNSLFRTKPRFRRWGFTLWYAEASDHHAADCDIHTAFAPTDRAPVVAALAAWLYDPQPEEGPWFGPFPPVEPGVLAAITHVDARRLRHLVRMPRFRIAAPRADDDVTDTPMDDDAPWTVGTARWYLDELTAPLEPQRWRCLEHGGCLDHWITYLDVARLLGWPAPLYRTHTSLPRLVQRLLEATASSPPVAEHEWRRSTTNPRSSGTAPRYRLRSSLLAWRQAAVMYLQSMLDTVVV